MNLDKKKIVNIGLGTILVLYIGSAGYFIGNSSDTVEVKTKPTITIPSFIYREVILEHCGS